VYSDKKEANIGNIARILEAVKATVKYFATHGFNRRIDSSQSKQANVDDQFYTQRWEFAMEGSERIDDVRDISPLFSGASFGSYVEISQRICRC